MSHRGTSDDDASQSGDEDDISILMPIYDHAVAATSSKSTASKPSKCKKKKKKGSKGNKGGGIGYTSGFGKTWDVNAYLKN